MIYALTVNYGPSNSKSLTVKFEPTMESGHKGGTHPFVFGSESHPADFRCQACGHFAWGWHEPAEAWGTDAGVIEKLAQAALDLAKASGMKLSPAMKETLLDWREELAGKHVSGKGLDATKVQGPLA
jgi:hypothetical protein